MMVPTHHVEHIWGMPISIDVRDAFGVAGQILVNEILAWLKTVDSTWSTHRDDSVITRFARGELGVEALTNEMHEVLDQCEELSADTDGAFDIRVPAPNGTNLEPSGYIKGWAIQKAAEIVRAHGFTDYCLNAGGDIALGGNPSPGKKWRVGIRHPHDPGGIADVLELEGTWAVATSAAYERGTHIVDPRSAEAASKVVSVTVLGHDLAVVDAHATALYVMGLEGLEWISERGGDAMMVTKEGLCVATTGYACHQSTAQGIVMTIL